LLAGAAGTIGSGLVSAGPFRNEPINPRNAPVNPNNNTGGARKEGVVISNGDPGNHNTHYQ
jgi:hypothetical protein